MHTYAHPLLGRLVQPRHYGGVDQTAAEGMPWAADNDCYQGLNVPRYRTMLDGIEGLPGCLFVTVPDVVGDHGTTLELWNEWHRQLSQPTAFVLQDGVAVETVPWDECKAIFVGGTTDFKLGAAVRECVAEGKRRGKWVHMGRVNSGKRIRYAASIGCDSVDGTCFARFSKTHLRNGLRWVANATDQLSLGV